MPARRKVKLRIISRIQIAKHTSNASIQETRFMKKHLKLVIGRALVVLLLVAALASLATTAWAQGPGRGSGGMMNGWGRQGYGPSMMGGQGYGPGMMGGQGHGPGTTGCPFFGSVTNPSNTQPISLDQAVGAAQQYVQSYGNPDLMVAHAMAFDSNIYVQVKEKSTGKGAFELLVNPYSGFVTPEPGPNMMWNTKYGHMAGFGGMVGGPWNRQTGPMTVTPDQAREAAQQWLKANLPSVGLSDELAQFYGYHTIDTMQDDQMAGMLSVNGYTGQVWYHTWHGKFMSEKEF
jgi:hypothetical protein